MLEKKTLSLDQAMAAQRALRAKLGLPDERFPMQAFVGMISDEIEKMRAAGHSDEATASLISEATSVEVSASEVTRYYAPPEERGPG